MSKFLITQPLAEFEFVFKICPKLNKAGRGHSPFVYICVAVCVCLWESNVLFYRRNSVLLSTIRFLCAVCGNMAATCVPFFFLFWFSFRVFERFLFRFHTVLSFFFLAYWWTNARSTLRPVSASGVAEDVQIGSGLGAKWAFHACYIVILSYSARLSCCARLHSDVN